MPFYFYHPKEGATNLDTKEFTIETLAKRELLNAINTKNLENIEELQPGTVYDFTPEKDTTNQFTHKFEVSPHGHTAILKLIGLRKDNYGKENIHEVIMGPKLKKSYPIITTKGGEITGTKLMTGLIFYSERKLPVKKKMI